jgi:cysteine desulfurase
VEIAALIGAQPAEIIFTSGATEALNLAIVGTLEGLAPRRHRIIVSPTEHRAVLDTCARLARSGSAELIFLSVNQFGDIDLGEVEQVCQKGAALVCVMAANNEIGTISPVQAIADIAEGASIPYLCDATQAVGRIELQTSEWRLPLLALSGHKLYAPQGIGALVVKRGIKLIPQIMGGGQQRGVRPGTLNLPGIVGLGEACRWRRLEMHEDESRIANLRDRMAQGLQGAIPNLRVNGSLQRRLAGNLHVSVPGVLNGAVISHFRERLAISTGAACSSGIEEPSHVLKAIGLTSDEQEGAFRLSLGKWTTEAEIEEATKIFLDAVNTVKQRLTA